MGAANSHSFDVGEQHENVKHVKMSDAVCESHHVPFIIFTVKIQEK